VEGVGESQPGDGGDGSDPVGTDRREGR
jgi:hypothetical protein